MPTWMLKSKMPLMCKSNHSSLLIISLIVSVMLGYLCVISCYLNFPVYSKVMIFLCRRDCVKYPVNKIRPISSEDEYEFNLCGWSFSLYKYNYTL